MGSTRRVRALAAHLAGTAATTGAGTEADAARHVDIGALRASIAEDRGPPPCLPPAVRALWHAGRGIARGRDQAEVNAAHDIVVAAQGGDPRGTVADPAEQLTLNWLHVHVHRIEDFGHAPEPSSTPGMHAHGGASPLRNLSFPGPFDS